MPAIVYLKMYPPKMYLCSTLGQPCSSPFEQARQLSDKSLQLARGTLRPKMGLLQDAFWSQLAPHGSVFRSGSGVLTVLPPRVFSRGQKPSKSFPKRSIFRRSKLPKIVPKRSTLHRPKLFLLPCMPSRVVCPQRICMLSRDLYALKGFVCGALGLGPIWARPMGPKSLEGIQVP